MVRLASLIAVLGLVGAGCADGPAEDPCADPVPEGLHYQYVVSHIEMPTDPESAQALAQNLDDDPRGRVDNSLGQVLSSIEGLSGYDLSAETDALIAAGELTPLLDLQALDLTQADHVGLELLHGLDLDNDPSDNLSGQETFGVDTSRGWGLLVGCIDDGEVVAGHGAVPVAVTFPGLGQAYVTRLEGARIDAQVDADGMSGLLGGGMSEETVDNDLMPALQRGLENIIARDCPNGPDSCTGNFGKALLELFDNDPQDGSVSVDELRNNSLVSSLLAPDLDLDHDGIKDHLSVGLGFTAVRAVIRR